MSDSIANYREIVLSKLAALEVGQSEICKRLDKLNGSVAVLYEKAATQDRALLEHAVACPQIGVLREHNAKLETLDRELSLGTHPGSMDMRKRVEVLEKLAESKSAAQSASLTATADMNASKNRIMERLVLPLLKFFGTGLIFLMFLHASELLKK